MNEEKNKNEYPALILDTNGTYKILLEDGVEINFLTKDGINEFVKNNKITIFGNSTLRLR